MRNRLGLESIALDGGVEVERDEERKRWCYSFAHRASVGRLASGHECALRTGSTDFTVTIRSIDAEHLEVVSSEPIEPLRPPVSLSLAPWFLYQRLIEQLEGLDTSTHDIDRAMSLFGRGTISRKGDPRRIDHQDLNPSQKNAVSLCLESDVAFIWGPPGTGKTTTLAALTEEFLARGKRILISSNTNAALDHVLAKIATKPHAIASRERAGIIRLGATQNPTHGTSLQEVLDLAQADRLIDARNYSERAEKASHIAARGKRILETLASEASAQQSLFATPSVHVSAVELTGLVPSGLRESTVQLPARELSAVLERRIARISRLAKLCRSRAAAERRALRDHQAETIRRADILLATLANTYLSPSLEDARFDVVIVDEASMATLPTLFYAAALSTDKVIMVGDPRQLPPIVSSDAPIARRVLGRNIFEVTVPKPATSPLVAMLDTQYRMCPPIGELVGELFYQGALKSDDITSTRQSITAGAPHENEALVVVDISGTSQCERAKGTSSRINRVSADVAIDLAARVSEGSVAVITPYAAQARHLRELAQKRGLSERVECSTIHRFQGQERDVVILDLVDASPLRPSRLLSASDIHSDAARLLNVSISRAIGKLVIVADREYFESSSPISVATRAIECAIRRGVCCPPSKRP